MDKFAFNVEETIKSLKRSLQQLLPTKRVEKRPLVVTVKVDTSVASNQIFTLSVEHKQLSQTLLH